MYIYGLYKCEVVEDLGNYLKCKVLEGGSGVWTYPKRDVWITRKKIKNSDTVKL